MEALQGPLVDCHAHVWEPDMPFAANAWNRPTYVYSAEDWQRDMAAHGIAYGVIAAASLFGSYNEHTLRALRRYPNLRGTVIVDPAISLAELRGMNAEGVVGVRLQWFFIDPLPDPDGTEFRSFLHRLRDLDMHVHLNIEGARLAEVAGRLAGSGVPLVIDHFGWHDPAEGLAAKSYRAMLLLMERAPVWVKLSSGWRHRPEEVAMAYAQDLLARFGPERLLWGSDAPWVGDEATSSYAKAVAMFHQCVPDPAVRDAIGADTYRFYFR